MTKRLLKSIKICDVRDVSFFTTRGVLKFGGKHEFGNQKGEIEVFGTLRGETEEFYGSSRTDPTEKNLNKILIYIRKM